MELASLFSESRTSALPSAIRPYKLERGCPARDVRLRAAKALRIYAGHAPATGSKQRIRGACSRLRAASSRWQFTLVESRTDLNLGASLVAGRAAAAVYIVVSARLSPGAASTTASRASFLRDAAFETLRLCLALVAVGLSPEAKHVTNPGALRRVLDLPLGDHLVAVVVVQQ